MSDPVTRLNAALEGRYRIESELGEGGMATVYLADDLKHERKVALKILKADLDSSQVLARFELERRALAVMDHPAIAKIFDAGVTTDGRPYFAMERVAGVPIGQYCDEENLTVRDRVGLFMQVCAAVEHAHQKGVIHRDLKPTNVLVSKVDGRPLPRVIDFGIAKATEAGDFDGTQLTRVGQVIGTPAYMSPEQIQGSQDVDTRTDVYSLGVVLYEILLGALPYDVAAYRGWAAVAAQLHREPLTLAHRLGELSDTQHTVAELRSTTPARLARELAGDLGWIVARAMEKDRIRRYGTASGFAADLRRYLDREPVSARPLTLTYRLGKFARRNRGALAAGISLLFTLLVGTAASTIGFVRADRNASLAREAADRAEGVSDFLDQMLRAADPVRGAGRETTVREVLDAASTEIASGALEGRPLVEIAARQSIGATYMHLGLLDEAGEHFDASMALLEATPGAVDTERVAALDALGQLRRREGDATAAEAHLRHALALADSVGLSSDAGAGESTVNGIRNDLGLVLQEMGRLDEAAEVLERLAESERRLLDGDDVELAATLNNLALLKRAQGDIDGAIDLFDETLGVLTAAVGESHVYVASVLESIGILEERAGRYQAADSLMLAALDMRRDILGDTHPDIVNGLNSLGLLHVQMDDLDVAEAYLYEALQMSLELLGEEHPRTALVLNSVGVLHLRRSDAPQAEAAFRRSAAIREEALGDQHSRTLNARANLARAFLLGGKAAEAESLARQVVSAHKDIELTDVVLLGLAIRTLGRALTDLERFEDAEEHLLEAFALQDKGLGTRHPQTQSDVKALVMLYEAWGREEQAVEWSGRLAG